MGTILEEIPEEQLAEDESAEKPKTPYEKLLLLLNDPKFSNDVALEKRIGLYKFTGVTIGNGNFSKVKKAVHMLTKGSNDQNILYFTHKTSIHLIIIFYSSKDKVAVKIVDRSRLDAKNLRMLSREISTLESLQHPFILRLFEGE
jgi:serine/threonine-protein kinase NIM1